MKLWVEGKLWIWDEGKDGLRERRGEEKRKEGTVVRSEREEGKRGKVFY